MGFRTKKQILSLTLVATIASLTLLYLSFYSTIIILLSIYFISLIKFKIKFINLAIFTILALIINYSLLLIFSSANYFFYFINLFLILLALYMEKISLSKRDFISYGIFAILLLWLWLNLDEMIYEIYIFSEIKDMPNFLSKEIGVILSFIHFIWFYIVLFYF